MRSRNKSFKTKSLRWFVGTFQKVRIPGLEGMSLYHFLRLFTHGIIEGALTSRAGSIAFSFFIALFPFALFALTLIPFIPIDGFQEDFIEFIFKAMPSKESANAVSGVLDDIANNKYGGLLSFGFLLSILLMTNGVNAILSGFEYTHHQIENRTIFKQYMVSLGLSLVLTVLLFVTIGVLIFLEYLINTLSKDGIVSDAVFWIGIIQIIIMISMILVAISVLYYFGTKEGHKISFFSPGTVFTAVSLVFNFEIFKVYLLKFAQYNQLYGSIGTVIVIMLFIWLNSIILLLGFELNTSLIQLRENKTHRPISK
jgi:membrane protein